MPNARPLPRETLAHNLQHLMEAKEWSAYDLARNSGVGQKTIWNILNQQSAPSIETVDRLASAFGLNLWHLIMPNLPDDLLASPSLPRVIDRYAHARPDDRRLIEGVAERAAQYDTPPKEPTGSDR